jgi:zinc protease
MIQLVKTAGIACILASGIMCAQTKKSPALPNDMSTFNGNKPVFVEEVKKTGSEIVIPFKRYRMANGMEILIHEDHSDPIVYVDVTYHVGSAREQEGRSGFAHFFEHMMFQGSKNVADEQHFKIITEAGGTLNGTTNTDRTNYFEVVPSNQFEKMLWLESDRMGFLLDSVTQQKFEVQRATVKNERGQRYDNAPYGLVNEKIGEALYPKGHPYSWTTIGYIEDLNRVDVNDLKRFYMRWYGPNNAVITIAGDVDTDKALELIQKYFGSIPRGPEVKPQKVEPVALSENRYISYEDNVKLPMLRMSFPTVKMNTKEDAALDFLANALAGSQGSPFYKAFVESKKAVGANAFQFSRELAGQFEFMIRANPGTSLAEMEKEVYRVLEEWEKKGGVTDDDINKYKSSYLSGVYDRITTVQGKGAMLAANFTFTGDANFMKKEMDMVNAVTKADVMAAYAKYIKGKKAVVLSCVPKGKSDLVAKPDTWKMYERTVENESSEYKNLSYTEPKDNFDRSKMPKAEAAKPVPVPDFYTASLKNNISLIGVNNNEIPKVNILISIKNGHRYEPLAKAGMAALMGSMLEQSTTKTSAEEIENKLDRLGSSINVSVGDEEINISVECLAKNIAPTMAILKESMFEPKFDKEEFELEKKKQLDGIMQTQMSAAALANNVYMKLLYGKDNVLGVPVSGTTKSVESLTIEDIKNYYNESMNSALMSVSVSGDVKKEQIMLHLAFLNTVKNKGERKYSEPSVPAIDKTKIYFCDKKNAAQSEIRIGYLAMPFDTDGEFYKSQIMNFSFGGAFNSRTNYLLREIKGWTYGCRSGFGGTKYKGAYTFSGGFKANTTDSTLVEVMNEMKKYREGGITDDELSFTRNAMSQSDALKYEAPMQKLFFIKRIMDYNLDKGYVSKQISILNSISKEEINQLAKKNLPMDKMIIFILGDKDSNLDKVRRLGYDMVMVDNEGNALN